MGAPHTLTKAEGAHQPRTRAHHEHGRERTMTQDHLGTGKSEAAVDLARRGDMFLAETLTRRGGRSFWWLGCRRLGYRHAGAFWKPERVPLLRKPVRSRSPAPSLETAGTVRRPRTRKGGGGALRGLFKVNDRSSKPTRRVRFPCSAPVDSTTFESWCCPA